MSRPAYLVGIDQGYSRTRVAVVSDAGRVLHVDEERTHFGSRGLVPGPAEAQLRERYRGRLAALFRRLPLPSEARVAVHFATNGRLPPRWVVDELRRRGLRVHRVETFSDVHAHYGLTAMPGNCVMYPCGSYYNLMYYDGDNRVTGLSGAYCDVTTWGQGLCAYYLGDLLLDVYARSILEGRNPALVRAVEAHLGPREDASIYDYVKRVRTVGDRGCLMQLAPLVAPFRTLPEVEDYLIRETERAILAFRVLAEHARGTVRVVFLGGSVFVHNPFLADLFRHRLPGLEVHVARGCTALGAIRFKRRVAGDAVPLPEPLSASPGR
jgi:hypothetical protein